MVSFDNTIGARQFAKDHRNQHADIEANWWQYFSDYRLRKWREELDELTCEHGIDLLSICKYMGITYTKGIGFYEKLPKKRSMYIGIGMALRQPVESINKWLTRYGEKRKLYAKDLEEDLAWIHLINASYRDRKSGRNYYREFEKCQNAALDAYIQHWKEDIHDSDLTMTVEADLMNVVWDPEYDRLRRFVVKQIDSFNTAWAKPRGFLDKYVDCMITAGSEGCFDHDIRSLNALRIKGYLDDSMINYLAGSADAINVIEHKGGKRSPRFKKIPKSKKSHISLALALGMGVEEIDDYLKMMGFSPLDAVHMEEGILMNTLAVWERNNPEQRELKGHIADGSVSPDLFKDKGMCIGVKQMLNLRFDLMKIYDEHGKEFPYLK